MHLAIPIKYLCKEFLRPLAKTEVYHLHQCLHALSIINNITKVNYIAHIKETFLLSKQNQLIRLSRPGYIYRNIAEIWSIEIMLEPAMKTVAWTSLASFIHWSSENLIGGSSDISKPLNQLCFFKPSVRSPITCLRNWEVNAARAGSIASLHAARTSSVVCLSTSE